MAIDFENVSDNAPKAEVSVRRLQALVDEADGIDRQMDELNNMLTSLVTRYNFIKQTELPNLMAELQSSEWKSEAGTSIVIDDFVAGSLPKAPEENAAAIKYLEEHGGGDLIKSVLSVSFTKSQHNEALALADDVSQKGYLAVLKSDVHAQTLLAYVRERMKRGEEIDFNVLGIYGGRIAKITHAGKDRATKAKKPKVKNAAT